jgi:hypothetical protein
MAGFAGGLSRAEAADRLPAGDYLQSGHRWRITLGKLFTLTASDSFKLGAYRADPSGKAKGGVVVIQEIFGVNHHIRAVCDRLAGEGYAAVAPAVRSPMRASSSPIRIGTRCCVTCRLRSTN